MRYLIGLVFLFPLVGIAEDEIDRAQLEAIENQERLDGATDLFGYINLNAPGSINAVKRSNPDHYKKIRGILIDIQWMSAVSIPAYIEANYGAQDVVYDGLWKTSYPAKGGLFLSFSLDETPYVVEVTAEDFEAVPELVE